MQIRSIPVHKISANLSRDVTSIEIFELVWKNQDDCRGSSEKKRQDKLSRINAAIADLATREDRSTLLPNWKQWVADQAEVKVQFLTRLINKEDELARPDWITHEYWS